MAYQDYINCSREALLEKMAELLPEKRLTHCLGVERAAIELAERFGVDTEKAGLAGLLHDYAKKLSDQEFLDLIDRYRLDPDLKNWGNNVWHGMVGIYNCNLLIDTSLFLIFMNDHTLYHTVYSASRRWCIWFIFYLE